METGEQSLSLALMIETVGLGGAEMVVLRLAQELRDRGHTVHPVVPQGHDGWLLDRFRESGFEWQTYDLRSPIDFGLPARLAGTLAELGVQVAHSHEFVMAVYGAAAAKRLGIPHVVTMHGNQEMTRRFRRRVALRWSLRNSSATVAVSDDTRRHLVEALGVRRESIGVVHNGLPVRAGDRAAARAELGVAPHELLLLSVGSLIPRKGHAVLIEALSDPALAGQRWKLAIAGQGEERPRLEALIRERGLEGRASLLGPRNDIPDLQAAADVFVMPSLWEGLPLAVLEAMFASNAIVATGISGIPEVIVDGETGLLAEPGDVASLRRALSRVMSDAALRERLGSAAARLASTRHTMKAMADEYERLYRRDLARASRSALESVTA